MKKMLIALLIVCILGGTVACGVSDQSGNGGTAVNEANETTEASEETLPDGSTNENDGAAGSYRIGFVENATLDIGCSYPVTTLFKNTVEAMGSEYVPVVLSDQSAEGVLTAVQNLLAQEPDAVVLSNMVIAYGCARETMDLCIEQGVYFSFFWTILDPEDLEYAKESEYFIGNTYMSNEEQGYGAAVLMGEAGCKKIATITCTPGISITEERNVGLDRAKEEYGFEVVATESDTSLTMSSAGGATIAENFISAYPDCDGILIAGMTQYVLPGVVNALKEAGREDIKVVGIDYNEYQKQFMEEGSLYGIIGGQYIGASLLGIATINALDGNRLSEEPIMLVENHLSVDSMEKCDIVEQYMLTADIYSPEELANCRILNNPEFNIDALMKMAEEYSIEDVEARRSN